MTSDEPKGKRGLRPMEKLTLNLHKTKDTKDKVV